MRKLIIPLACCLLLTACHSNDVQITLTPAALEDCGPNTKPTAITIHWDARKANPVKGIEIWVSNDPIPTHSGIFKPNLGTLWENTTPVGTATTGPWVRPGMAITITDNRNNDILRQIHVPSRQCSKPKSKK